MPVFSQQSLKFLKDLKKHNDRDWFQPRKAQYEECVKAPTLALIEAINLELATAAPEFVTEPKKALFRIYRDTRFSQDKTPYKTHTSALFWQKQANRKGGGVLYVALSAKEAVVAGGSYMPTPQELLLLRQHIAEHYPRLIKILKTKAVRMQFGELNGSELQRAPKGFDPQHQAIAFLKRKQWGLRTALDPQLATTDEFVPEVLKRIRLLLPLARFLNEPLVKQASRAKDPLLVQRAFS
ncbi:MAG: DUF2461 domain-containing protein [Bryobacteraceae bacterium]